MKTTQYKVAAILLTLGVTVASVSADTKRVNNGRAGYTTIPVAERVSEELANKSGERPVTIGVFVGEQKVKKARKLGGRAQVGLRKVQG